MGIPNKIKTLNLNNRTEKSLCNLNETLDRNNLFLEYPTHFGATYTDYPTRDR